MTAREVVLEGGAPWGFRMHGGVDQNQPLRISRVNPGSKAAHRGIREGDLISSINGQSTKSLTNTEAHGLLRNAGELLKLGLNEDPGGSPKRRQYRTVHQETLQETVKRSSVTSYSITKIVESADSQSEKDNESITDKTEQASINGTSKSIPHSNLLVTKKPSSSSSSSPTLTKEDFKSNYSSDNALASQRSSYTNCTLSPSSPSILSEDGTCSCTPSQDNVDKTNEKLDNMNDNQSSSRSKRRRQRRKNQNRKISEPFNDNDNDSTRNTDGDNLEATSNTPSQNVLGEEYTVQSPVELSKDKNGANKTPKPVKSRSLDDDEMIKIQEVSEVSDSEQKGKDSEAIVSEVSESEVEWEETENLDTPPPAQGSLSTFTLPLEGCISEQITLISPQEEKTLRDFLEGLNLVNGPEEAANQVYDKNSPEGIKQRKAKKKAELEQYFVPLYQNPRFLDVISEESRESSDRDSDREQSKTSLTRVLRKGTPEDSIPPKVPPRPKRIPPKFAAPVEQNPAVLVDTRLVETPAHAEAVCSTYVTGEEAATASNVEIVYLTSSETDSAEELESTSSDSYMLASERNSSNEDLSEKTLVNVKTDETVSNAQELNNTLKNDYERKESFEEIVKSNETEKTISSSEYSFTVKSMKDSRDKTENIVNIDLLNELTPPPTPDNSSPNETKVTGELNSIINFDVDSNLKIEPETHTNALTPPPPSRSSSSSRSSSRGSSLCTAKYNPSIASITDVIMLTKEDIKEGRYFQALTLREICLQFLLSLPFGKEVLEELADVSKYIESYTRSLPSTVLPKLVPNLARAPSKCNNRYSNLSVQLSPKIRQEDISYVKRIPEREVDVANSANLPTEETLIFIENNAKQNDNKENGVNSKKEKMERRIPVQVDPEYKPIESAPKEIVIPVKIEQTVKEKSRQKEVIIPIKIQNETSQKIEQSSQRETEKNEIKIPIRIEKETHKPKEVIIPIKREKNDKKAEKSQEFIIPMQKEASTTETKTGSLPVEKEIPTHKEVIIPITKEVKIPITKEVKIPVTKEVIIPVTKEVIIPVTKEVKLNDKKEESTSKISEFKETNIPIIKEWTGLPTESDPKLLVCLSPKQKHQLEKSKQIPDEAGTLLELHEKFINRRTSSKDVTRQTEETVTITSDINQQPLNRLLTIIREEPTASRDDKDYLYFVEREPNLGRQSSTLPRGMENARLHAKDLTEWLNLARNKSMSESNLTTVPDIPENNLRNNFNIQAAPTRRTSLPHDLFEKQMIYIQEKEREIQRQLEALEEEKRLLNSEMAPSRQFHEEDYYFSRKGDFAESKKRPTSMPLMPTEYFRQQMYEEYMDKFAEREDRKQHKIIKVTSSKDINQDGEVAAKKEIIHPIQIEDEFMNKVQELQNEGKLERVKSLEKEKAGGKKLEEGDDPPVLVMDGEKLKEANELPKHLQEFIGPDGIWSPGLRIDLSPKDFERKGYESQQDEAAPPVWSPKSANSSPVSERKEFRSVNFQSPVLSRRNRTSSENLGSQNPTQAPPWKGPDYNSDTGSASSFLERRLPTSRSTPATGFSDFSSASRLPKAQNPTITLLQKAREGQLPKGASYLNQETRQYRPKNDRPPIAEPGEVLYQIKHEYTSESDTDRPRKMTDLGPRKFEGIGPVSNDGLPLVLRSEVKDQNQSKWYKRMYDTIHKQKPHNDEYVTIRYKQKRAQYPYTSGYLSEPEPGAYDSDFADYKYQTLDRRRPLPQDRSSDYINSTMPRPTVNRSSSSDIVRNTQDNYNRGPGRIENYIPGRSSIQEKETKQWWDEVMDIFDGHLEQQTRIQPQGHPKSFINQALKESGYESDSTLVFRRREETAAQQLSPKEQREAYKEIQKGGDIPLHGLRKPAPERPKEPEPPVPPPKGQYARNLGQESPRKYMENEVTIHYKTPVRQEIKDYISEDELAHRQAETMKKIYQEERRKKYLQVSKSLQELQDMNSRRHTDNFIPSQKSPISLNRYDDFDDLAPNVRPRARSPEHRLCARALYNFVGQSARELTFRKGDIIYLRRQIDKNWYEGEINAMVGLFPANYVEIIPFEGTKNKSTLRKAHEGQARAKYNFVAQTHLELSLAKGELVVITRKIDENWYEGKIGGRKGIFPSNYVEILIDPQSPGQPSTKPVASPASHSLLLNGSSSGKESMGSHSYTPSLPNDSHLTSSYRAKPIQVLNSGSYSSLSGKHPGLSQALHIETQNEPIAYRAMYKYKPQNDDELELLEGDTVYVLEKCDDGWYVGSSDRTGAFGTFPGNYVEKI